MTASGKEFHRHSPIWVEDLFRSAPGAGVPPHADQIHPAATRGIPDSGTAWARRMFRSQSPEPSTSPRLQILKDGVAIHEMSLPDLEPETLIGRHSTASIRLEAQKLAMLHACLWNLADEYYIEDLDSDSGTYLNRARLQPRFPIQLKDGAVVDLPGYQLLFTIPNWPDDQSDSIRSPMAPAPSTGPRRRVPGNAAAAAQDCESERPASPCPTRDEDCLDVRVADIIEETHDVKTFRLTGESVPDLTYQPGQYVACLLEIDGATVQRSYSLSSSPSRPESIDLTVKRVPGGLVSNWLCDRIRPGDRIRLKPPSGKFTCTPEPPPKLLFIAAGSGITPIMSMCRWLFDTTKDVDVKILASFRTPHDIIFRKELASMAAQRHRFRLALTMTGDCGTSGHWMGFTGRINQEMIALFAPDYAERQIFLCGPDPFMAGVRTMLRELDVDRSRLQCESFGSQNISQSKGHSTIAPTLRGTIHDVAFTRTGVTVQTDEHMTLLELAECHGIEIDYNCRSGICGECEVKCRGEVTIRPECEIDARQRAAGFVYACTTSARSDLELDA